jgi:ABC-2 type transport system ATP-binding protein
MTPTISLQNISKTYKSGLKKKTAALSDISFSVNSGEVFGIVGPNGAGKSTALKILLGFLRYDSGSVELLGHAPQNQEGLKRLGFLPENPCLYDNLTANEHLVFAGNTAGLSKMETKKRSRELLTRLDLLHAADQHVRKYSKGMVQRAALAYALIHEPELLILDEPMSGLDPIGRQLVIDIIHEYHQKRNTILFCSHILTDVERICDRIGIMNKGCLLAITTPAELQSWHAALQTPPANKSPLEAFFLQTLANDTA